MKKTLYYSLVLLTLICTSFTPPLQIIKTSLQVVVRNELGNEESDANVCLYKTKEDYEKQANAATPVLKTDKAGKVIFKNLDAVIYYISAEKGDRNNAGGGEQTTALQENRINKLTVVISE